MADDTPETCPECGYEFDEDEFTTSTKQRWEYTGTILALILVASLPALVTLAGFSVVTLAPITQGWWVLYTTVVLMAATWTFGKETLEAVQKAKGK